MTILQSSTGSKKVNIMTDNGYDTPIFRAMYVQVHDGQEQVLDSKSYKSLKMAEKWANNKLDQ